MSDKKPHVVISTDAIYATLRFLDIVRITHCMGEEDHLLDETESALRSLAESVDFIVTDPGVVPDVNPAC